MDDTNLTERVAELEKEVAALKAETAARGSPTGAGGIAPQGPDFGTVSVARLSAFPAESNERSERVCEMFSGLLNALQAGVDEAEQQNDLKGYNDATAKFDKAKDQAGKWGCVVIY